MYCDFLSVFVLKLNIKDCFRQTEMLMCKDLSIKCIIMWQNVVQYLKIHHL